jgi:hypothetical protein
VAILQWHNASRITSRSYTCGYCGNKLASDEGYFTRAVGHGNITQGELGRGFIYVCHYCNRPSYFADYGAQYPGPGFGASVGHIPSEQVEALYEEARNCMQVNVYTAAVMCCRKLLMNVAVSEGADEGKSFASYVKYLVGKGHVPSKAAIWVDHIRDKGNDANHEIRIMNREDAERIIKFSEMMLRIMYEYPAQAEEPTRIIEQQNAPQTIGGSGSNPAT